MRLTKRNSSEVRGAKRQGRHMLAERMGAENLSRQGGSLKPRRSESRSRAASPRGTHSAATHVAAQSAGSNVSAASTAEPASAATPIWKKTISIVMALLLAVSFLLVAPAAPQVADAAGAGNTENSTTTLAAATDDGSYNAEVTYGENAQLPQGAYLTVDKVATDSDEYANVLLAAAKSQAGKDASDEEVLAKSNSIGMDAIDVTLHDAGGNQIKPAENVAVDVKIEISTLSEKANQETLQVDEIDESADGTTVASAVATTGEAIEGTIPIGTVAMSEDGRTTAEFETNTLGTFGISYQLMDASSQTIEISVGDTKNLSGTTGYGSISWTSSNSDIVSVDENGRITGKTAGTATITHEYYNNSKKRDKDQESESWSIKVIDGGSSTVSEKEATATSNTNDPAVTVKETGNAKKISDYHVVVEDADGDWSDEPNCLKAYHIYLADDAGNEVSASDLMNGKLNLKVTLTYSTLPSWFSKAKTMKHYNNSTSKTEQSISNVEFDSSARTISFIVHGFSDFVISSSGSGSSSTTVTTEGGSILDGVEGNDANAWQIVSNGYAGNSVNNKVESEDGNVRVQKNVIPTGVENEFLVYLSVDKRKIQTVSKTRTDEWLRTQAKYVCGSSTNLNGAKPGTVTTVHGQVKAVLEYDATSGTHVIIKYKNQVIGETWVRCSVSNPSFYLWTSTEQPNKDDKCIALAETKGTNEAEIDYTADLTDEAYELLINAVSTQTSEETVSLSSVTDQLGTGFAYEGLYSPSSVNGTVSESNGTINWEITEKKNPSIATTEEKAGDGTGSTTTWYLNVAELLYKVKYTPATSAGLETDTDKPVSIDGPSASDNDAAGEADVNKDAVLSYKLSTAKKDTTANFPVPEVRGLLYELRAKKVDEAGNALLGATFGLYTDAACENPVKDIAAQNVTAVSDEHGVVDFKNLQYGTYYMKEISPSNGYAIADSAGKGPYVMCYTTTPEDLKGQGTSEEALYATNPCYTFSNYPIVVNLRKYEAASGGPGYDISKPLAGAKFKLYTDADCNTVYSQVETDSNGSASWSKIPAGTYYLKETYAPTGYQLDTEVHTIVVHDAYGQTDSSDSTNLITVDGQAPDTPNTVTIADSPNPSLPITAGNGIAWLLALGAFAAVAGAILVARSRRIAEAQHMGAHSK